MPFSSDEATYPERTSDMESVAGEDRLDIHKPTVVIDERQVRRNIERMAEKAKASGVLFRPHFKTHYSEALGAIYRDYAVSAICVSSVTMAQYFADCGWKDITISTPLNVREIRPINELAGTTDLGVLLESVEAARFLVAHCQTRLKAWIEIDVGYHRTGVWWEDAERVAEIAGVLKESSLVQIEGILTHAGHSYHAGSKEEVRQVCSESVDRMRKVKDFLSARNMGGLKISVGDTPTCSILERYPGVDEIRPGNFVFYDVTQHQIGSCSVDEIAMAVACPVIARHPERGEIVVYGGAVHLSKDHLEKDGKKVYGLIALPTENGWTAPVRDAFVSKVSQEHGTVRAGAQLIEKIRVGDVLMVLPVHSCLVSDLHRSFRTLDGRTIAASSTR